MAIILRKCDPAMAILKKCDPAMAI